MPHAITHEESLDSYRSQIDFVLNSYKPHGMQLSRFQNIILGGLGGSGIGAKIVSDYMQASLSVPSQLIGDYDLPAYANDKTLVILSSYSGNTEETLSLQSKAQARGCAIITVTAGGELLKRSKELGYITYPIESGFQPRMTLGYSLSTLFLIFGELANIDFVPQLSASMDLLSHPEPLKAEAAKIIDLFKGHENNKYITICDTYTYASGIRFCQQLQENAKAEGFLSVLPENNHNMIETYYGVHDSNFILFNSGKNQRVNKRFGFVKALLEKNGQTVYDFSLEQFDIIAIYRSIYVLDWVSIYLSNSRKVDNMAIPNILDLKGFLSA